jgi:hypothetical protein
MRTVISDLAAELLRLQGNGIAADVKAVLNTRGVIGASLQMDLKRIESAGIPVDLVFEQGIKTLGLEKFYKPLPEMQGMPMGGGQPGGPGQGGPGQGGPGQGGPGMNGGGHGAPGQGAPTMPPPAPKGPGK